LSLIIKDIEIGNSKQELVEILEDVEDIVLCHFSLQESQVEEPKFIKEVERTKMVQR
jgi:hypothetical protein